MKERTEQNRKTREMDEVKNLKPPFVRRMDIFVPGKNLE